MQHTNDKQQVTQAVDSLQPNNKLQDLSTVSDAEILQLIHELGNCFVEDNAYQLQKENKATALEMAKHFMGMGGDKGFLIIGANGTGKTLIFRIMQAIAPFFERSFEWLNASRRMNARVQTQDFEVTNYLNAKPLYINDLGRDLPGKDFGNPVDAVYDIMDFKNDLQEEGARIRLYATTNLGIATPTAQGLFEYPSLTERYDARIASRANVLFNVRVWENSQGDLRGRTNARKPLQSELQAVMLRFMQEVVGFDPKTDLTPNQISTIEKQIGTCRQWWQATNALKDAGNYYAYCNAYRNLKSAQVELKYLIFEDAPKKAEKIFGQTYRAILQTIKDLYWKPEMYVSQSKGSLGKIMYQSLGGVKDYENRTKNIHRIEEVVGIESNQ